ncbi:MAG: hypothetical protein PHO15_06965 [Eubacteriales bacterium]|nr:hypothetical protein [Eubacteriales bacterium]
MFIGDGPSRRINGALYIADYDKPLDEIKRYKKEGGVSFVDAQPYRCGRMAESLLRAGEEAGVNIIACTGFHKTEFFEGKGWIERQSEETLVKIYAGEIEEGMYSSDNGKIKARAGIVKCAAPKDWNTDRTYGKLFRAAAETAVQTGSPVLVHMDPDVDAAPLLAFFGNYGIRPERIILCHLDRTRYDFKYHEELAAAGAYLEYDTHTQGKGPQRP